MNWIILPIITIIIISVLRIRCMRQIFKQTNRQAFLTTSLTSILSVAFITLWYYFKQRLELTEHIYTYSYIGILMIASIIYFRRQRFIWRILQSIVRISLTLIWWAWSTYSLAALGEESFKWIYIKKYITWLLWKIIFLGIISGIVFWRTENIVYTLQYIIKNETPNSIVLLISQRWFIPIIVHIGSICVSLLLWFNLQKNLSSIIARWIAIFIWVWSHYLFNISQIYQSSAGSGIMIIWYLMIISYGLFRSDILYTPQDTTTKSVVNS